MRIGSTNLQNTKTSFKAQLQLDGDINNTPKKFIDDIYNDIKQFGTNKDIVSLNIEKEKRQEESWSEMGHRCTASRYQKNINVATLLNGKIHQKIFSYSSNWPGHQNYEYIQEKIVNWLKELSNN